jgi:hypothetical protein
MAPGAYEFRLMGVDPDFPPLLKPIARSAPIMLLNTLKFRATIDEDGIFHLRVSGLAVGTYNVEASETLGVGGWQVVGSLGVSSADPADFSERVDSSSTARYYRVSR